uniref:Uncharacterized protein n=1 Tax=Arundo donax TaxID=35708 RepID=A0A0A8YHL3_ARUDO
MCCQTFKPLTIDIDENNFHEGSTNCFKNYLTSMYKICTSLMFKIRTSLMCFRCIAPEAVELKVCSMYRLSYLW